MSIKAYKHVQLQPDQRKLLKKMREYVISEYREHSLKPKRIQLIDTVFKRGTYHQEEKRILNNIRIGFKIWKKDENQQKSGNP